MAQYAFGCAPVVGGDWSNQPWTFPVAPWSAGGPSAAPQPLATWGAIWNTSQLSGSYDLRVTVTDTAGQTAGQVRTITFCGTCPRGPPAVDLHAISIAGGVRLTWTAPAGIANFQVRRSASTVAGPFKVLATTQNTSFEDPNLTPVVAYSYQLWSAGGPSSQVATALPLRTMVSGSAHSADNVLSVTFANPTAFDLSVSLGAAAASESLPEGLARVASALPYVANNLTTLPQARTHD